MFEYNYSKTYFTTFDIYLEFESALFFKLSFVNVKFDSLN